MTDNLFYKPTSDMTNQELNMLITLNTDAVFDLTEELNLLRARDKALREEIDKRSGVLRDMRNGQDIKGA